ncbi:MAG: tetratricopeptide repeat protein [bacterium]|nr:tetratricopeptide repeat protein [bacterium]
MKKNLNMKNNKILLFFIVLFDLQLLPTIGFLLLFLTSDVIAYYGMVFFAKRGNITAQEFIADAYLNHYGSALVSAEEAEFWLRQVAEEGRTDAQYKLANCYKAGLFGKKDSKQAVLWYRKGAEQGHKDCQRQLLECYAHGDGTDKDMKQVISYYRQGAEQGDIKCIYQLALCYKYGNGVPADTKQAINLFRQGAEQGVELGADYFSRMRGEVKWEHKQCHYRLGLCYKHGDGVSKDLKQAVNWFSKGGNLGDPDCRYQLGVCYQRGYGVNKDLKQAASLFTKAADDGHMGAQYNLGQCYELGLGVQKDRNRAIDWYRQAAKQGNSGANKALARLGDTRSVSHP